MKNCLGCFSMSKKPKKNFLKNKFSDTATMVSASSHTSQYRTKSKTPLKLSHSKPTSSVQPSNPHLKRKVAVKGILKPQPKEKLDVVDELGYCRCRRRKDDSKHVHFLSSVKVFNCLSSSLSGWCMMCNTPLLTDIQQQEKNSKYRNREKSFFCQMKKSAPKMIATSRL